MCASEGGKANFGFQKGTVSRYVLLIGSSRDDIQYSTVLYILILYPDFHHRFTSSKIKFVLTRIH